MQKEYHFDHGSEKMIAVYDDDDGKYNPAAMIYYGDTVGKFEACRLHVRDFDHMLEVVHDFRLLEREIDAEAHSYAELEDEDE